MDKNGVLGEVLEKGQGVIQKTGKTVADSATGAAKIAVSQVAGDSNAQTEANATISDQQQIGTDKAQTQEFVKELYAPSKPQQAVDLQTSNSVPASQEQAELASVRQKLHDEVYYIPLTKGKTQQQERPAEKVEHEKQKEMRDLQKKEAKKPPPLAVQRAQQTAEKFRGVSG